MLTNLPPWIPPAISASSAFLILLGLIKTGMADFVVDRPNDRSLHKVPVPRTGGLAIMSGVLSSWLLLYQPWLLPMAACVIFLMAISFADDLYGLPARWRFLAHSAAAAIFLSSLAYGTAGWIGFSLILVSMVWMINLFNFMDGADGLAGGMTFFGFTGYSIAAWQAGDISLAVASSCVAAASISFLKFNSHPAKIFMGDAGSIPLGFLASAMGYLGWQRGIWPFWFPVLVFSSFIIDASVTLLKRLLRGEKVWQAHREHYYQRLVQIGWGHRKTVFWGYGLMALTGGSAVAMLHRPGFEQGYLLALWVLVYVALLFRIERLWKQAA